MRRILVVIAVALAACDVSGPEDEHKDEGDLVFARYATGAQPESMQASFWAVHGQDRTLVLRYAGQPPAEAPLLEFRVSALSLLLRPGGQPFLPGDSVQITVTVDTQRRFLFDFQPSGIVFAAAFPAVLRINYSGADDDLNRDGLVNQVDAAIAARLRVWLQAPTGLLWVPLPTAHVAGLEVVEALVPHFTGFALAD